ncbi:poly [ADP-ribose] polymerase tankyrase-like [Patiria miniata]|uniref:Poly [ADP-ribose] polymerase n=1 Tax=Patiria miniata TaxID=46514 RepID=A0A914BI57_PATMI|nr:poly [ADP-ribose] polymerase tankyrase-like [Patiria miniata]
MRVKVVPNNQLTPNLNIKVVQKDPMFEVKNESEIPEVSKFVQCKRSIRAVLTNDMSLLKKLIENKNVPSVFHKRSVSDERTALAYAVRTENHAALRLLLPEIDNYRERAKLPDVVMEYQSSGRARFANSGFGQGFFMGRGNKEGNNAFTKDLSQRVDLRQNYIDEVIKCGVSTGTIDLILATDTEDGEPEDTLFKSIHKIARAGHYKLAGYLVDKARQLSRLGFNKVHQEVLLAKQPEDISRCLTVSVKKKAYWEVDKITPVHFAAINPNPKILDKLMSILPEYSIMDSYGLRPIHYAAVCEGSGPLELLLNRGVNPEDKHTGGVTPLMMAAKAGRAKNVEVLLKSIEEKRKTIEEDRRKNIERLRKIAEEKGETFKEEIEPEDHSGVKQKTSGGNMAIHFASEGGSVDCIQILVNHGADIEAKMGAFYNNITPLMIATLHGHFQAVEALLDMGAVIEQKDKFNRTALMLACMEGNYPIATLLLRKGAIPDAQDSSGNTPTHYAAAYGWWHCLKLLLKAGADPNFTNDWKTTPLGVAFMKGHIGCSDLLLEQPTVNVNFRDNSGATLLSLTAESPLTKDMVDQIHYLLEKKADLTLVDIHGRNVFHYLATSSPPRDCDDETKKAVKSAKQGVAKLLIEKGCDASARDKDGNTAVNIALQQVGSGNMDPEFVKLLLEHGFSLSLNERVEDGKNALHMMAQKCAKVDMGALLPVIAKNMKQEKSRMKTGDGSHAPRTVTLEEAAKVVDNDGYTPFLRCVSQKYPSNNAQQSANVLSMVKALVEVAKSDINTVVGDADDSYKQYSALHFVCTHADEMSTLNMLLKWKPNLELFDNAGLTPLHLSVQRGRKDAAEILVNAGADVNKCTRGNSTSLLIAASLKMDDILPLLVTRGANVNAVDPDNKKTALHYVMTPFSVSHCLANCKVLLNAGADPNALDAKGRTPLHYAVNLDGGSFDGAPSISELLIKNGASVFVRDIRGRLPLHYAFVKMRKHRSRDKTDPIEIVTVLLDAMKGQQVDTQDKFGQTPLHWAAYRGATISAKYLVQKGKNLEIKDRNGNTPLAMTALGGHDSVAIVLIEAGANINITVTFVPPELEDLANKGSTEPSKSWIWKPLIQPQPVPFTASFVQAVLGEGWESVIFLIMPRMQKFRLSFISVMQAIFEAQKLQLACTMLLKQPDDKKVQATDSRNRNFLHLLAIHSNLDDPVQIYEEIANPLLERGVKLFARDDKGCTPLHYAAANQNNRLCKLFAEKDQASFKKCLSCKDNRGRTPTVAVFWNIGHSNLTEEVLNLFTSYNASLDIRAQLPDVQARIPQQRADTIDAWYHGPLEKSVSSTPLILMIHTNDFKGCKFLLQKGASCNYADENGLTPLMHAVQQNEMELVKLLLDHNCDKHFERGEGNLNAGSLSTWAVNLWEQRKSKPNDKERYIKTNTLGKLDGLDYIDQVSDYDISKALEEEDKKKNEEKDEMEDEEEVEEDEKNKKDLEDEDEKEALLEARKKEKRKQLEEEKRQDAAKKFAETSKVDLNAVDSAGRTAIHHLVKTHSYGTHENVIMLDLLFRLGAKISMRDKHEQTPLDYAMEMRSAKLAIELQRFMKIKESKWKLPKPTPLSWTDANHFKAHKPDFKADAQAMIKQLESSAARAKTKGKKKEEETGAKVDPLSNFKEGGVVLMDEEQGIPFDALLTRVDVKHGMRGMNNFYKMQIIHQTGKDIILLFTRWGRIGEEGQYQRTPFSTKEEASKEFRKIFRAKTRTDWADVKNFQKVDKKYQLVPSDPWRATRKEALKEFKFDLESKVPSKLPKVLQKAIKELIKPNVIAKALSDSGIDTAIMNMGNHLPRESLLKAKEVLVKIREVLEQVDEDKKASTRDMLKYQANMDKVWDLSSEYYQLIPCVNFTYDRIPPLTELRTLEQNAKKLEILLDLATTNLILLGAQYRVKETNPLDYISSCLGCQIQIMDENDQETQLILQYIDNTTDKDKHSVCAIFRLAREGEDKELRSLKLDNHRLLWHGSKCSNVISILKRGLLITPPEAAVTGYRYGRGIYTSDAFAKSIDYSIESFGRKNANFVFLCEVALGKMAVDHSDPDSVVKDGFDSLQAQNYTKILLPSRNIYLPSGVTIPLARLQDSSSYRRYFDYTEYVVHRESQVCLRYLVQCHPDESEDDDDIDGEDYYGYDDDGDDDDDDDDGDD